MAAGDAAGRSVGTFSGGEWYEGTWDGDEPHGKGAHHYASGDVYTGKWRRGARHGRGTLACANLDSQRRLGRWVAVGRTQRWGRAATCSWPVGADQLAGRGRLLGGNGETYDGEFRGGVRDGEGECVCGQRATAASGPTARAGRAAQNGDAYYEGGWHLGEMWARDAQVRAAGVQRVARGLRRRRRVA